MTARIDHGRSDDEYEYAALGYTLHNLYTALESYFLRIAKFFENNLDSGNWHRSLVDRMTLHIEGIRPALFNHDFAARINELMRFRHLFRNLYRTPLIPEKVRFASKAAEDIVEHFTPFHEQFDAFLVGLMHEIDNRDHNPRG